MERCVPWSRTVAAGQDVRIGERFLRGIDGRGTDVVARQKRHPFVAGAFVKQRPDLCEKCGPGRPPLVRAGR
jgi:hypothetical protein